jgi:hypothetical protein
MKILTFFCSLFENDSPPDLNPSTGAQLIPGTLLDITGHCVDYSSEVNDYGIPNDIWNTGSDWE